MKLSFDVFGSCLAKFSRLRNVELRQTQTIKRSAAPKSSRCQKRKVASFPRRYVTTGWRHFICKVLRRTIIWSGRQEVTNVRFKYWMTSAGRCWHRAEKESDVQVPGERNCVITVSLNTRWVITPEMPSDRPFKQRRTFGKKRWGWRRSLVSLAVSHLAETVCWHGADLCFSRFMCLKTLKSLTAV